MSIRWFIIISIFSDKIILPGLFVLIRLVTCSYRINNGRRGDGKYASVSEIAGNLYVPELYLMETLDCIDLYDLKGTGSIEQCFFYLKGRFGMGYLDLLLENDLLSLYSVRVKRNNP